MQIFYAHQSNEVMRLQVCLVKGIINRNKPGSVHRLSLKSSVGAINQYIQDFTERESRFATKKLNAAYSTIWNAKMVLWLIKCICF